LLKIENFRVSHISHSSMIGHEEILFDTKLNSILALKNISELPDAFLKVVHILHDELKLLNEVFGLPALKGLAELLPKLSKYKNPPNIEKEKLPLYAKYIKGVVFFITKYEDEAIWLLINDIVNFNQKMGPFFILNDNKMHKQAKSIINRICLKDNHNKIIIQKFMEQYAGEKDNKNMSKDNSESLHLSELN
jgi:hypothetical protein